MIFNGIYRRFSTQNSEQYTSIGNFWDEMAEKYGRENLRGLGFAWKEDSIGYVIGLKKGLLGDGSFNIELPDVGWTTVTGKTEELGQMYEEIYKDGNLEYEIETFSEDGTCQVEYIRKKE